MKNNTLKNSIMRRVYAVWFVKKVLSPAVIKIAIAAAFLFQLKEYVSVRQVIANAPSLADLGASTNFFMSAFSNSEYLVQFLSLGLVAVALFAVRDVFRGYSFYDGVVKRAWAEV